MTVIQMNKPPPKTQCTCGCGSTDLQITIDKKRWFINKEHILRYIESKEAEMRRKKE
ncbi:MAG: hypothetical protein ACFFB3_13640 [Candidatus Hodarchaeota archaeon]